MFRNEILRVRRRASGLAVLTLLGLTGILLLTAPAAHADTSVTFADNQPLAIDLAQLPTQITIKVVNASAKGTPPVMVKLALAGPPAACLRFSSMFPIPVGSGLKDITVKLKESCPLLPGTGTLVLSGDDGSVDRETVNLVGVPEPASASPSPILPGTFDTLTVRATAFSPSFFRPRPTARLRWGLLTGGAIIVAGCLCRRYWRSRDKMKPVVTELVAVGAIGAILAVLVLGGGFTAAMLEPGGQKQVSIPPLTISPAVAGAVAADLVGDNGQIGLLVAEGSSLNIKNVKYAGTYSGTINTQPTGPTGTIKTTLTVRDWWLYAFAAVVIGVLIGLVTSLFYRARPSRQVEVDTAVAAADITRHDSDWSAQSAGQAWSEPYLLTDFAQPALGKIAEKAKSDPAGAKSDLAKLTALDDAMEGLRPKVSALGTQRAAMRQLYKRDVPAASLDAPGWLAPAEKSLSLPGQSLDDAKASLTRRSADIDGAITAADLAADLGQKLDKLAPEIKQVTDSAARDSLRGTWMTLVQNILAAQDSVALQRAKDGIDALRESVAAQPKRDSGVAQQFSDRWRFVENAVLRGRKPVEHVAVAALAASPSDTPPADQDTLLTVTVQAADLPGNAEVHWEFSDGLHSAPFPAPPPGAGNTTELSIRHSFASGSRQVSATVCATTGEPVAPAWTGHVTPSSRARRLQSALIADDRAIGLIAGILAVGSGMAALYLNSPAWGSAGDYITAVLWGSVTSEGLKLVAGLLTQQSPTSSLRSSAMSLEDYLKLTGPGNPHSMEIRSYERYRDPGDPTTEIERLNHLRYGDYAEIWRAAEAADPWRWPVGIQPTGLHDGYGGLNSLVVEAYTRAVLSRIEAEDPRPETQPEDMRCLLATVGPGWGVYGAGVVAPRALTPGTGLYLEELGENRLEVLLDPAWLDHDFRNLRSRQPWLNAVEAEWAMEHLQAALGILLPETVILRASLPPAPHRPASGDVVSWYGALLQSEPAQGTLGPAVAYGDASGRPVYGYLTAGHVAQPSQVELRDSAGGRTVAQVDRFRLPGGLDSRPGRYLEGAVDGALVAAGDEPLPGLGAPGAAGPGCPVSRFGGSAPADQLVREGHVVGYAKWLATETSAWGNCYTVAGSNHAAFAQGGDSGAAVLAEQKVLGIVLGGAAAVPGCPTALTYVQDIDDLLATLRCALVQ
jgi:hypothetical protein